MDANMDKQIGLQDLAGRAGLSLSHFAFQFRASTNQSPHGDRVRGNMRPLFRLGGVLVGPIQKDGPLARLLEWYPHRPLASARVRILITAIVISTLWFTCDVARASRLDDNSPTDLTALRVKADKAKPGDRCFLYAKIVHQLAELAAQQFNSGDSEGVSSFVV
jgi:hypothetical protein